MQGRSAQEPPGRPKVPGSPRGADDATHRPWGPQIRDRVLALLAAVLAVSYVLAARGIEDSLLSDEVGAGGVPQAVGVLMLLAAVALFGKSFIGARHDATGDKSRRTTPIDPSEAAAAARAKAPTATASDRRRFITRTAGLVLILVGYTLLLPLAGYMLSIGLLVLSAGWLAGAPLRAPLLLAAAVAGPLFWMLFGYLLQVRMPAGSWWG